MGKGLIVSGGDDGLYQLQVTLSRGTIDAQIIKLDEAISDANDAITQIDNSITQITSEIDSLTVTIDYYQSDPVLYKTELQEAVSEQARKIAARGALEKEKGLWELKLKSLQARKEYLSNNMPENPVIAAWCADLSETLTGTVGTIEVPGERGTVLIRPGYADNAAHDADRDGQLAPAVGSTPAGVFFNLAMLPAWQKWWPTYRFGTLTSVDEDNDICNVLLEEAVSSAQNLSINQTETLSSVPIVYMDGNADPFAVGDDVVIEFVDQDWTQPRVIGFKDHPRPCDIVEEFGDNREPTDYPWTVIHNSPGEINWFTDNTVLTATELNVDITVNIPAGLDPADFWPLPYFFSAPTQRYASMATPQKYRRYLVVETSYIHYTQPEVDGWDALYVSLQYDVAQWGISHLLDYPSNEPQTFVYDMYAPNPPHTPPTNQTKFSYMYVYILTYRPVENAVQYTIDVKIDSIRVTNHPPPPEEAIYITNPQ